MKYFARALGYLKPHWKLVTLSVLCALLVAQLFSLSLITVLPMMKILIGEEGVHGWVNRRIVKERSGISFFPIPLAETLADSSSAPLQIQRIADDAPAGAESLSERDTIIGAAATAQGAVDAASTPVDILALLAGHGNGPLQLAVRRVDGSQETITLSLDKPPFYTPWARRVLSWIPQGQGPDFKRDCLVTIILIMLGMTIMKCLLRFLQDYLARRAALLALINLRRRTYHTAVRLPLCYYSTAGTSDTISRFVQDSNQTMVGVTTLLTKVIREPLNVIFMSACAFWIDAKMTGIVVLGAPVAGFVINRLGKKMKKATRRTLEAWSGMLARLQESLQGIRVVKGYHQEEREEQRFEQVALRLFRQQCKRAKVEAGSGPILEALGMIAASAGMVFAAQWLTQGAMTTSDFFALIILLAGVAESGRKLGDVWPRIQTANTAAERVFELIDAQCERDIPDARAIGTLQQQLIFDDIVFTYPNSTEPALNHVSLNVTAGETIAVVGPNGSGKTTLLSLIPRFYEPQTGRICIDGQDVQQATLESLRRQIGIVTQQTIVFNDTIAANIAYGNHSATMDQIVHAAQQAYAHEFITAIPTGYDTIIGEQGTRLSGGQLQRLAIARAILCDPAILIFDEATSQIDADSEAKIQQAIRSFSRGRTSFLIAHRLSTVIDSDRIVVMNRGRIEAVGTHQELLEQCALYRQLYETQFAH